MRKLIMLCTILCAATPAMAQKPSIQTAIHDCVYIVNTTNAQAGYPIGLSPMDAFLNGDHITMIANDKQRYGFALCLSGYGYPTR